MKIFRYKNVAREEGYSLPEVMVVLVIIGILVMIAIPIYNSVATRAKMTEARIMLNQVYTLQRVHYMEFDHYTNDLNRLGFEQNTLITEGGRARYMISIESADANGFVALASSIIDYSKNGRFNVWEINESGEMTQRVPD